MGYQRALKAEKTGLERNCLSFFEGMYGSEGLKRPTAPWPVVPIVVLYP